MHGQKHKAIRAANRSTTRASQGTGATSGRGLGSAPRKLPLTNSEAGPRSLYYQTFKKRGVLRAARQRWADLKETPRTGVYNRNANPVRQAAGLLPEAEGGAPWAPGKGPMRMYRPPQERTRKGLLWRGRGCSFHFPIDVHTKKRGGTGDN